MAVEEKIRGWLTTIFAIVIWLLALSFIAGQARMEISDHLCDKDIHWTTMERFNTFTTKTEFDKCEKRTAEQFNAAAQSLLRIENKIDRMQERNRKIDQQYIGNESMRRIDHHMDMAIR